MSTVVLDSGAVTRLASPSDPATGALALGNRPRRHHSLSVFAAGANLTSRRTAEMSPEGRNPGRLPKQGRFRGLQGQL